jgi:LuxR family maltose regulon positive regulatory protein
MPRQFFYSNAPIAPGSHIYLERQRVDSILEQAVRSPVVIVTAGAGYGKTQAVYSFLRKYNVLTSWIQLYERDNFEARFWENFTAAVAKISAESAAHLTEVGFPETDRQFDRYMRIPSGEVIPDLKYVFVYDDVHLIQDKKVLRFLEHSITTPFPNITTILISRTMPAINTEGLRAEKRLTAITEEDIRFSREETAAYFALLGLTVSTQTISAIYRETEGWAFAIYLAALALKNAPRGTGSREGYVPLGMRTNIFKLIESEIITGLSADLRKAMITASLIDHRPPEVLRALTHGKDYQGDVKQVGSFFQYDAYRNEYRIHQLLLEYLSSKQDELTAAEKNSAYETAARWCAENNQKLDAITYYERAGNYEKILETAYTFPRVIPNHIARILLAIYERAPRDLFDQNPKTYMLYIRLLIMTERIDRAEAELAEIIARLEKLPPEPERNRALAGCYNNLGSIGLLTSTYTRDYTYVRSFEQAHQYYRLSPYKITPPVSVSSMTSYVCRVNSTAVGEMEKYIDALAAMIPHTAATMGGCDSGLDDLARGELALFREDIPGAEQAAQKAIRAARANDQWEIENRALFFLLRIHLYRGDCDAIRDIFKQLEAQLTLPLYLNRTIFHDIVCGWFYAQIGDTEQLAPWLKNDFEESDLNSINHGLEILVKAKYHFAEKRYPAALAALEGRENKYGAGAFVIGQVEMKALEAVCRYRLRDKAGAFADLKEAYELARPNALYLPFTELGKDMRTLANAALQDTAIPINREWLEAIRRNASAYAKKLFITAKQFHTRTSRRDAVTGSSGLSPRELAVLTGLSLGLTREEIAKGESISINTVKSVIKSVYYKLDAVNRADAVRIAAARKLLP